MSDFVYGSVLYSGGCGLPAEGVGKDLLSSLRAQFPTETGGRYFAFS